MFDSRSWLAVLNDNAPLFILFLTGPMTLLYAFVSFGYYFFEGRYHENQTDSIQVGVLLIMYGMVWCIVIFS